MCNEVQTCGILSGIARGFSAFVGPAFNLPMEETSCTYCGQCVMVSPTASLTEIDHTLKVWHALNDPSKHVVVQTAPIIRVTIGELFFVQHEKQGDGSLASFFKNFFF
jgi:NADH-quinone oxidoreductase subunit G